MFVVDLIYCSLQKEVFYKNDVKRALFFLTKEEKMKESIKNKIIEKARDLLFRSSEEDITMNLIAKELGITAPTLYHYFKGKDELISAAQALVTTEVNAIISLKFPPSIPAEMKILTTTGQIAEYFMKTDVPPFYLIEDPKDRPILLKEFREKFAQMFDAYVKSRKGFKLTSQHAMYRYLALMAADIINCKSKGEKLPDDFAEIIFGLVFN